jgi:hypothetical protein
VVNKNALRGPTAAARSQINVELINVELDLALAGGVLRGK